MPGQPVKRRLISAALCEVSQRCRSALTVVDLWSSNDALGKRGQRSTCAAADTRGGNLRRRRALSQEALWGTPRGAADSRTEPAAKLSCLPDVWRISPSIDADAAFQVAVLTAVAAARRSIVIGRSTAHRCVAIRTSAAVQGLTIACGTVPVALAVAPAAILALRYARTLCLGRICAPAHGQSRTQGDQAASNGSSGRSFHVVSGDVCCSAHIQRKTVSGRVHRENSRAGERKHSRPGEKSR